MKTIFLISILLTGLNANAELSDDRRALRACGFMNNTANKSACREVARGHKFDPELVDACARGVNSDNYGKFTIDCLREFRDQEFDKSAIYGCVRMSNQNMMDCLRMIAGRKAAADLTPCTVKFKDQEIFACYRQLAWTPITTPPTTMTGGADTSAGSGAGGK